MSLTEFIKSKEIREEMDKRLQFKTFKIEGEIKASPQTKNYSLVGTAFDYMLRFFIERNGKNKDRIFTTRWIAEKVTDHPIRSRTCNGPEDSLSVSFKEMEFRIKRLVKLARKNHSKYIKDGEITDSILKSCIHLAQIDPYYRADRLSSDIGTVDKMDITDLRNLISISNHKSLVPKRYACLNPTFGYGSRLVGGADADLIIDGIMIDIKTTKKSTFSKEYYHQLVGYYILSLLGKVSTGSTSNDIAKVNRIGVYFSRYGILHTFQTKKIVTDPGFKKLVEVFERKAIDWCIKYDRNSLPWE